MTTLKKRLSETPLSQQLIASPAMERLMAALQLTPEPESEGTAREEGSVKIGVNERILGFFDLDLIPPGQDDTRPYLLTFSGPPGAPTGFRFAITLNAGPLTPLFKLLPSSLSHVLKPAKKNGVAPNETLVEEDNPQAQEVQLSARDAYLVLHGEAGGSIGLRLSANREPPDDVIQINVEPATVLIGSTGFGLELPHGIVLDMSDTARPPQGASIDGVDIPTPADLPPWRGIAVNRARFYLPGEVPFLGGHAVDAVIQVGMPGGIAVVIDTKVPRDGDRPEIAVRIECIDPAATGLGGFVPTLVEAVMELPLADRVENFGPDISFGAGKPVRARLRYARTPSSKEATAPASSLTLALESQGPDGLLKIDSTSGGIGAKIAVTAATIPTALIADGKVEQKNSPDGRYRGVILRELLTAAVALSSFLEAGQLVLHNAELLTQGGRIPAGQKMRLKLDYSVAATVTSFGLGSMSIAMRPQQPLRIRIREVVLSFDPEAPGLSKFHLDYAASTMEIEDPGGWRVQGPGALFDVMGTRSGRGSMWIEVDLRFKLDLGPVKVSGATVRATLDEQGRLSGSLRGLEAGLSVARIITGKGGVQLTEQGFRAALDASIVPLEVNVHADVQTEADMVKLSLGADLPGPLPLGSTGLAIYGIGGMFAANGKPRPIPPGADPITTLLDWDHTKADAFVPAPATSFGVEAVLGTAPDMGFTFSVRAGLFLTTPDFAVRGAVAGRFLGPRMKLVRGDNAPAVFQARGTILVDPADGVTIAIEGKYEIPHVLRIVVPVAARFPVRSPDWLIHLGADGWTPQGQPSESREMGPVRAILLPGILDQAADAYLMFRGGGITAWPRGGTYNYPRGSFVIAFGCGFDIVFGLKPIVWAQVSVRADILVGTNPLSFVGQGSLGGKLNIGPFSVGVDAKVNVVVMEGQEPYFKATMCGKIDLFFDEIEECIPVEINARPAPMLPAPPHPLENPQGQSLVDDHYRRVGELATRREDATPERAVWADTIPLLAFATAPTLALAPGQFPDAGHYPEGIRARPIGSELLRYEWTLQGLQLINETEGEVLEAGPMSAAWVTGKQRDAAGQPQPAELALLTPRGDLALHAMPSAGGDAPDDPLGRLTHVCQLEPRARAGWALGGAAHLEGDGYRLPPAQRSADPLHSQVTAHVRTWANVPRNGGGGGFVLDYRNAQLAAPHFGYHEAGIRPCPLVQLDELDASAWLDPGALLLPPDTELVPDRDEHYNELIVELDDPLSQSAIWLVVERRVWTGKYQAFWVVDDLDRFWNADAEAPLGEDLLAVRWLPPADAPLKRLRCWYARGARLGILGVRGITRAALEAAARRKAAAAAEAEKIARITGNGPPPGGNPPSETTRCVLKPGCLYRIDVTMAWSGELHAFNEDGKRYLETQQLAEPKTTTVRSYWFRTAARQGGGAAAQGVLEGSAAWLRWHRLRRDLFDPAMLERHLLGYEPAQSELHRFARDPVQARFAPGHVAALAGAYGYHLRCAVRRLDQPGDSEPDRYIDWQLAWARSHAGLAGPHARIASAYLDSPCGMAPDVVEMTAPVDLSCATWYEAYVQALPAAGPVGRLPGVAFRTSRWKDGPAMLAGLSWPWLRPRNAEGIGSLALPADVPLLPLQWLGDDGAFDAWLAERNLDGWPVAAAPRTSLLWVDTPAGWRFAGVMIESPEPIHRPGRFEVVSLVASQPGAPVFDIRLADRAATRLLFATSAPFQPRRTRSGKGLPWRAPELGLNCRDLPIGGPVRALRGRREIPLLPPFTQEA